MIKLKTATRNATASITDNVLPICFPEYGEFKATTICHITGWGYTGKSKTLFYIRELPEKKNTHKNKEKNIEKTLLIN